MVGSAFTVTVAVIVQPFEFLYVMVVVPAAIPVTTPKLLTLATAVLEEIQGLAEAAVADPESVVVEPIHTLNVPVIVGSGFTVTVAVLTQPFELVYVIIVIPAESPFTTPALFTVATAVLEETQAFDDAAVPEPVSVVVKPWQTFSVPVIVGSAFTVTVAVITQPLELVYVITEFPAATPVTTPLLFTVAIAVLDDLQGFVVAAVPDPVNVVVKPAQTVNVPEIVGSAFTVTVAVMIQLLELVYVITVVPAAKPFTRPLLLTVAIVGFEETHGFVVAAVPEPLSGVDEPIHTFNVPVIIGAAITVITAVILQPLEFV